MSYREEAGKSSGHKRDACAAGMRKRETFGANDKKEGSSVTAKRVVV